MPDSIVIVSGGMDSVTLLHHLVKKLGKCPALLTFIYGQKHEKEVAFARENAEILKCPDHQILDLQPLLSVFENSSLVSPQMDIPKAATVLGNPQPSTYVPNRNMVFLSIAAALAETRKVTEVYYGAQAHDLYGYWDCTPDFLNRMNEVFGLNRAEPIRVLAPFIHYSKTDILREGIELGVDYLKTWSCYEGREKACGICPTCAERLQAFANLKLSDPIPYEILEDVSPND